MTRPPLLRFHATPAVTPAPVRNPVRLAGRPTTSARCRRCARWLVLDDDELEIAWEPSSPGVICWNCDQDERDDT